MLTQTALALVTDGRLPWLLMDIEEAALHAQVGGDEGPNSGGEEEGRG